MAPLTAPEIVNVPAMLLILASAAIVMAPDIEFVPDKLASAPSAATPAPEIVNGSAARVIPP